VSGSGKPIGHFATPNQGRHSVKPAREVCQRWRWNLIAPGVCLGVNVSILKI
jgi:hypothetical protein